MHTERAKSETDFIADGKAEDQGKRGERSRGKKGCREEYLKWTKQTHQQHNTQTSLRNEMHRRTMHRHTHTHTLKSSYASKHDSRFAKVMFQGEAELQRKDKEQEGEGGSRKQTSRDGENAE